MQDTVRPVKEIRMVIRVDARFADRIDEMAFERFDGNRSLMVRAAVRELIERAELAQDAPQEAEAA